MALLVKVTPCQSCYTFSCRMDLKFAMFSLLIAAVWLVFCVPIVIYHLPQGEVCT